MVFRFEDFEFDEETFRFTRASEPSRSSPKSCVWVPIRADSSPRFRVLEEEFEG